MSQLPKRDITITIQVDGEDHRLEGIPSDVWKSFQEKAKEHFPNSGDDAWASHLSEVIVATVSKYSYFMTDVPKENADAIHAILQQVNWNWEQFHVYLLKSAILKDNFRIISFHNKDDKENQSFGTLVATGINPIAFSKLEKTTGHSFEKIMATILIGATEGTLTFDEHTTFIDPV